MLAGIAALLIAVLLGAPAAARAGDASDDLGNAGGMNYRANIAEDFVGSGYNSFVNCLEGDRPISGGVDLGNSATASRMGGTYPVDEDGFIWRSAGYNLVGGMMDLSFFGICRESDPSMMKFRSATKSFNPDKKRTVRVACPDGFRAIGGGIEAANPLVAATVPYDAGDPDKKPDDGWRATAVNAFGAKADLTAHVSCRKAESWDLKYKSEGFSVGDTASAAASTICQPGAAVTGGGTAIAGPGGSVRVHETFPVDFGDVENTTPEDGWQGNVRNDGMSSAQAVTHAICRV